MIITESIKVKVNSKHVSKYRALGYICKVNEIIELKVEDLSYGSNIIVEAICDICNNKKEIKYRDYLSNKRNNSLFSCSVKCSVVKREKTTIGKYGVSHHMKIESVKEKIKQTNLERYGVNNPNKLESIKEKIKQTNLERYGAISNLKIESVKEKIKQTNLERYGTEYPSQSEYIKQKVLINSLKKWGSTSYTSSEYHHLRTKIGSDKNYDNYIGNRISKFKCDCGEEHKFEISSYNYLHRIKSNIPLCTVCYPIGGSQSIKEGELFKYIKSIYHGEVIQSYRDGLEIDIYIPELNLGFEFNGLYWHSDIYKDKNYHLNKTNYFKERGIRIIHIWEDDWDFKNEIVKSQLRNWLGLTSNKIFARKCKIKELSGDEVIYFLEENNIHGVVNSTLELGLYHGDELVSLMTLDKYDDYEKIESACWIISRFCNKRGFSIIGGASKIIKYFINNYDVNRVIGYSETNWSFGSLYEVLGFKRVNDIKPDYKYFLEGMRVNKRIFKKSENIISESKLNIPKIWDCGRIKWEILIPIKNKRFF
jgi:hypothetical protein